MTETYDERTMTMSNDNFSNDEVRRQLRAVDRANDAVMPRWREALDAHHGWRREAQHRREGRDPRCAVSQSPATSSASAASRSSAPRCSRHAAATTTTRRPRRPAPPPVGTTPPTTPATTPATEPMTTEPAAAPTWTSTLAKTAASLEKLAVDVYGTGGRAARDARDHRRGDDVRRSPPDAPRRAQRCDHRCRRGGRSRR